MGWGSEMRGGHSGGGAQVTVWLRPITACLSVLPELAPCVPPPSSSLGPLLSGLAGGRELICTGFKDYHRGPREAPLRPVWRWGLLLGQSWDSDLGWVGGYCVCVCVLCGALGMLLLAVPYPSSPFPEMEV